MEYSCNALINSFTICLKEQAIQQYEDKIIPKDEELLNLFNSESKKKSVLSYYDFLTFKSSAPVSIQKYLKSPLYLSLRRTNNGAIKYEDLLKYIQRCMDIEKVFLSMMKYSHCSDKSYLTEKETAIFIHSILIELTSAHDMSEEFIPYYMTTAARKMFFHLDSTRRGRVSIKKLSHSSFIEELLFLRKLQEYEVDIEPAIYNQQLRLNWFYYGNTLSLFNIFTDLDLDQNGTLNIDELYDFAGTKAVTSQLTRTACEQIIRQHNLTTNNSSNRSDFSEIDYIGFINLVYALESSKSSASLNYFWKVLDVDGNNRVTVKNIEFFYQDVFNVLRNNLGFPAAPLDVVVNEILDLVGCNDNEGISHEAFMTSNHGHLVASILLDASSFLMYESRESQLSPAQSLEEEPQDT